MAVRKYQFDDKVFKFLNHIDEHTNELKALMVAKFEIVKIYDKLCQ